MARRVSVWQKPVWINDIDRIRALRQLASSLYYVWILEKKYKFKNGEVQSNVSDAWNRKYLPNGDKREYMSNWVLGA